MNNENQVLYFGLASRWRLYPQGALYIESPLKFGGAYAIEHSPWLVINDITSRIKSAYSNAELKHRT